MAADGESEKSLSKLLALCMHPAIHIRCHAMIKMLELHREAAMPDVVKALADNHEWVHWVAIEAARRQRGRSFSEAVAAVFADATPAAKATLLEILAIRREAQVAGMVLPSLSDPGAAVREAACKAARNVNSAEVAGVILSRLPTAPPRERRLMMEALLEMPGQESHAVLAEALSSGVLRVRAAAADLLGRRGAVAHLDPVLKRASDPDAAVRESALRSLGVLARPDHLDALLTLLIEAGSARDAEMIGSAIRRVVDRHPDAPGVERRIARLWPDAASVSAQSRLVGLLGIRHTTGELELLEKILAEKPADEVVWGACQALVGWPSAAARPALLSLVKGDGVLTVRRMAFVGFVHNVERHEAAHVKRNKLLRKMLPLSPVAEDKRVVFEACVRLGDIHALGFIADVMQLGHCSEPAVAALKDMAPLLIEKHYGPTIANVKRAIFTVENEPKLTSKVRRDYLAELKACMDRLNEIAATKNLMKPAAAASMDDEDLGLDLGL
jgi:HEAT repeat protein